MTSLPVDGKQRPSTASVEQSDQSAASFELDVLSGLSQSPKRLHCKHLYDQRGSQLFDRICELPEYYPTRTELAIMDEYADQMTEQVGEDAVLVELGSGSSQKTRVLLDHLRAPAAYLPVDISREHLLETADKLRREHPGLLIHPLVADFTQPIEIPASFDSKKRCVYFPGSTIGNLESDEAIELLQNIAVLVGHGGGLLIGFDLQKETAVLHDAYNDSEGITAAFNLNLLHRINREADADLDVDQFDHHAIYSEERGRIEISIVSQCDQTATVAGREFEFDEGELIHTEYSHKYTRDGFVRMADAAGFTARKMWTDPRGWFAVMYLESNHGN